MGEWTPIFKKGDRQDARNYHLITSLIAVDKIFELLLSNQVTSHYDETLYYRMPAYRKRHSCETTLLMLIEDWKQAVDSKQMVSVLSTDMSKAFDSLSHSLMERDALKDRLSDPYHGTFIRMICQLMLKT